jgi:hypothetical protein
MGTFWNWDSKAAARLKNGGSEFRQSSPRGRHVCDRGVKRLSASSLAAANSRCPPGNRPESLGRQRQLAVFFHRCQPSSVPIIVERRSPAKALIRATQDAAYLIGRRAQKPGQKALIRAHKNPCLPDWTGASNGNVSKCKSPLSIYSDLAWACSSPRGRDSHDVRTPDSS